MNKGLYIVVPMLVALLASLIANFTGAQPGLYGGITLIVGVIIYLFWAKNHKDDEPTPGAP